MVAATTRVDLAGLAVAHAADLARLQGAQQLGLHIEGQLPDLVQEDGAPVRGLEGPDAIAIRAGERALGVTEELALDEVGGDRAAVDDDEGLAAPRPAPDDLGRDQLLARPALALDEDVRVALADALERREQAAHGVRGAVELAEAGLLQELDVLDRGALGDEQDGVAELQAALRHGEVRVADRDAEQAGPVQRALVDEAPPVRAPLDPAVEARDVRIGQDDVVDGVGSDAQRLAVDGDDAGGGGAGLGFDGELDARRGDRRGEPGCGLAFTTFAASHPRFLVRGRWRMVAIGGRSLCPRPTGNKGNLSLG